MHIIYIISKGHAVTVWTLKYLLYLSRQVPTQSCWILDGFPADVAQAHMLEKALGGICEDPVESITINLVADPNPPKPPSPPAPVLDLVVLLDIPDECVVQRAFSHIGTVHCSWKTYMCAPKATQ